MLLGAEWPLKAYNPRWHLLQILVLVILVVYSFTRSSVTRILPQEMYRLLLLTALVMGVVTQGLILPTCYKLMAKYDRCIADGKKFGEIVERFN